MQRFTIVFLGAMVLTGCGERDLQNSTFCGLIMQEAGFRIMDQFPRGHALLTAAPPELFSEQIPTRAMGHPTGYSIGASDGTGQAILGFVGEGLPALPGFGVALVDDSSEVFRGVAIFEAEPGRGFPQIGTITGSGSSVPLFGMRIYWPSVSNEDCPLFGTLDTSTTTAESPTQTPEA
jgi:hypothetical protein